MPAQKTSASNAGRAFKARLEPGGEGGAWVLLKMPFSVRDVFGKNGIVRVKGTMNGTAFRTSLFPSGDGSHHLLVNKGLQAEAGVSAGSMVTVTVEADHGPAKAKPGKAAGRTRSRSK